jgi:hypothetical protein
LNIKTRKNVSNLSFAAQKMRKIQKGNTPLTKPHENGKNATEKNAEKN